MIEVKVQLESTRTQAAASIEEAKRTRTPVQLKCDYGPIKDTPPFHVQAVCRDDDFTYIRSTAKESFAIYEIQDGESHVLNIRGEDGHYVIPKVLERAYLAKGDKRFHITRQQDTDMAETNGPMRRQARAAMGPDVELRPVAHCRRHCARDDDRRLRGSRYPV